MSVDYWAFITSGNNTLYVLTSESIYESAKCKNNRLSEAIAKFHHDNLWIKGSQLEIAISTAK